MVLFYPPSSAPPHSLFFRQSVILWHFMQCWNIAVIVYVVVGGHKSCLLGKLLWGKAHQSLNAADRTALPGSSRSICELTTLLQIGTEVKRMLLLQTQHRNRSIGRRSLAAMFILIPHLFYSRCHSWRGDSVHTSPLWTCCSLHWWALAS